MNTIAFLFFAACVPGGWCLETDYIWLHWFYDESTGVWTDEDVELAQKSPSLHLPEVESATSS
jgi:hypothetical protein